MPKRYEWEPTGLPTSCVCGKSFTVDHCLSCSYGGYTIMWHNELRDILLPNCCRRFAQMFKLNHLSPTPIWWTPVPENCKSWRWSAFGCTLLPQTSGLTIDNPLASSNNQPLSTCYRKQELEKRRHYDQRVREVEHGSFTPLVFNTLGGIGPTASVVFKRISSMIADKTDQPYHSVIRLIRCKLTFSLLRSTITCLRGSRSSSKSIHHTNTIADLALIEGRVCQWLSSYSPDLNYFSP